MSVFETSCVKYALFICSLILLQPEKVNSAGICLQDLGFFKNLRVIRGIYSTEHTPLREDVVRTKFALSIFANSQFPAQLRMQNLRMVSFYPLFRQTELFKK